LKDRQQRLPHSQIRRQSKTLNDDIHTTALYKYILEHALSVDELIPSGKYAIQLCSATFMSELRLVPFETFQLPSIPNSRNSELAYDVLELD
jgi:hypothetical protein